MWMVVQTTLPTTWSSGLRTVCLTCSSMSDLSVTLSLELARGIATSLLTSIIQLSGWMVAAVMQIIQSHWIRTIYPMCMIFACTTRVLVLLSKLERRAL